MNSSVVKVWCSKCACFHCEDRSRPKKGWSTPFKMNDHGGSPGLKNIFMELKKINTSRKEKNS